MSASGFLPDGYSEHKRAYHQHIAELRKRLEDCNPRERAQIESEIEDAQKTLRDAEDDQILW